MSVVPRISHMLERLRTLRGGPELFEGKQFLDLSKRFTTMASAMSSVAYQFAEQPVGYILDPKHRLSTTAELRTAAGELKRSLADITIDRERLADGPNPEYEARIEKLRKEMAKLSVKFLTVKGKSGEGRRVVVTPHPMTVWKKFKAYPQL